VPFLGESARITWSLPRKLSRGCLPASARRSRASVETGDHHRCWNRVQLVCVHPLPTVVGGCWAGLGGARWPTAMPRFLGLVSAAANIRLSLRLPPPALLSLEHRPSRVHGPLGVLLFNCP